MNNELDTMSNKLSIVNTKLYTMTNELYTMNCMSNELCTQVAWQATVHPTTLRDMSFRLCYGTYALNYVTIMRHMLLSFK